MVVTCDYIAQLNSADQNIDSFLSVMKFWTCSEFHDWQQTGDFL